MAPRRRPAVACRAVADGSVPGGLATAGGGPPPPVRGATFVEGLIAAVVLLVLVGVFLWTPLSSGGAYSSDDLLQSSPLVRTVPDDFEFSNTLLTDPVLQMHPWLEWNKENLLDGDLPVWNPYNGAGAPHLANFVSAVLSPFSAPFYVMPWTAALLVSAALKLLVLGLFTYLFLRKIALSHLAGLVGAAGFMFAAYNVLWLAWPHPGAAICLPAGLYFAEVAIQARTRVGQRAAWCGYALAVLGAFLAGHPETLFFSWGLVLAYVPLRLLLSRELGGGRQRLAKAGQLVVASALAVGLAGVQLLPFAEYLQRSTAYEEGSERAQAHFDVGYSALHAFPDLFGAPGEAFHEPQRLVGALKLPDGTPLQSNYNESLGFYVGLLMLLLAGVGVVAAVRRRSLVGIFLAVAAVVWFVYVHDLGGIGHSLGTLPLVELSAINRSHPIWAFAVCVLAAFGFDALAGLGGRWRMAGATGVAVAGILLIAGAVALARVTIERTDGRGGVVTSPAGLAAVDDHLLAIALTFLAGVAVLATLAAFGDRRPVRVGAGVAVVALVFAQSGYLMRDHNPTIDERLVFARSPGLDALAAAAGPFEETVSVGNLLSADANLWYRLRSPDSYDGMNVYRYEQLRRDLAALPLPMSDARELDVLGIRYVAAENGIYPAALPAAPLQEGTTFTSTLSDLHALTAVIAPAAAGAGADAAGCQVTLDLVDTESGETSGRSSAPCRQPYTTLSFPPLPSSAGRTYTVAFGGPAQVLAYVPWAQGIAGLEQVDGNDRVAVYRAPASPGRYFSPAEARPVTSDDEARRLLVEPGFAMGRTVLVHDDDVPATTGAVGEVEVLEQRATEVRLRVTRADPGWLVAIQNWYPGWTASVDGKRVDLERADYTFSAVAVGAGTHDVVLRYRPVSVRYGMIVTGEALVLMVIWLATARTRTPRARRPRIPWDPSKPPEIPEGSEAPEDQGPDDQTPDDQGPDDQPPEHRTRRDRTRQDRTLKKRTRRDRTRQNRTRQKDRRPGPPA